MRECDQCETPISYETGFTFANDGLFCTRCRPVERGYTLADLEQWRDDVHHGWQKIIRDRQIRHMEELGPDVYFHALGDNAAGTNP